MKIIDLDIRKAWLVLAALAIVFFLGSHAGASDSNLAKVKDPEVLNRLADGKGPVDIIVLLKGYSDYVGIAGADNKARMAAIQSEIRSKQDNVLNQLGLSQFELRHQFENILGFSGKVTQEGITALVAMPDVELIEEDRIAEAHLAQGIPLMNASAVRSTYNGTGVSVAIVDTGIDYTHIMLGGGGFPNAKVIGGYDLGDADADPLDCNGHGTSVAGISAGTLAAGPGDYIGGVAHNARLYALKIVSGCAGSAFFSTIAAAWDWAVTHKNDDPNNPILVINTSFGGGYYTSACDSSQPTLAASAANAVANGITLFGSSGNDGYCGAMAAPACVTDSISVGAVYDANIGGPGWCIDPLSCIGSSNVGCTSTWACFDLSTSADLVTCYSNSAAFLDILAPSNDAYTTAVSGGYTSSFGGTSAASPYSAGAAAILQSYGNSVEGFYYTPAEIKSKLVNNGDLVTDPKSSITTPRVNVDNIIGPAPTWDLCFQDISYATKYWMNLEYGRLLRGQAFFPSVNFPAPITGQYDPVANEATFSVDYLNQSGLRFYRIDVGTMTGETWGILDSDSSYFNGPRAATLVPCGAAPLFESNGGESGAVK